MKISPLLGGYARVASGWIPFIAALLGAPFTAGKLARRIKTGAAPHGVVLIDLAIPQKSE